MRKAYVVFLSAGLLLMVLPCALMPFLPSAFGAENRLPAPWPALTDEDGLNLDFPAQYEAWLQDHVALRDVWISAYSRALRALGTSSEEQVILGKDGWLFFRETLDDYTGLNALSDGDVARLALTLDTVDAALRASGSRLIVAVVPNKASVYPEKMCSAYPRSDSPGNAERLSTALSAAQVPLFDLLRRHAAEGLYFREDTRWNALGARYAASAILSALEEETGIELPLRDLQASYSLREDWRGDLRKMLDPYTDEREEQQYFADQIPFSYQGRVRSPEDLTIRTTSGASSLRLLVLRDSFSNQLIGELSGAAGEVTYLRAMPLPLDAAEGTDAVLLEIAERRLPELLQTPPDMLARPADAPPDLIDARPVGIRVEAEVGRDCVRLFGALEEAPEGLREVLLGVQDEEGERWYAAFPISGVEGDGCRGFSAKLEAISGDAQICVYMLGSASVRSEWCALHF